MVRWRAGRVLAVRRRWSGAVELDVETPGGVLRALAYPELVGDPEPGDRVLLCSDGLINHVGDDEKKDPPVKKFPNTGVDEEASPHRAVMAAATSLDGMPVVTADLHSALPAIVAGIRADQADCRVAYVMTDGGALPAWFSRTLDGLRDHLVGTITTGQAFGGDLEASTVHTGLLAARHVLRADIAVVAQGPGNLGTGTTWGFSGVALGEAINAIGTLGGRAVGSLRVSDGDRRPRHRGVSHHTLTAYGKVALLPADLPVPDALEPRLAAEVDAALAPLAARHRLVRVPTAGLDEALRASPVPLSTMGRGLDADHAYFLTAAAAGRHATLLVGRLAGSRPGSSAGTTAPA